MALTATSAIGLAVAVALAYFVAARLGLLLLNGPGEIAMFWPASGVAVGVLVVLGQRAAIPVIAGVIAGTVIANLTGRVDPRPLLLSGAFSACNAIECCVTALILQRRFGDDFGLQTLRQVFWFVGASVAGPAIAAAVAADAILAGTSTTGTFWDLWLGWIKSDIIGILTLAPAIICWRAFYHTHPSWRIVASGLVPLALLVLMTTLAIDQGRFMSNREFIPMTAMVLPPLLWLAARHHRFFAVAGMLCFALEVVLATTYGYGWLGDPSLPLEVRAFASRIRISTGAIGTLVATAIFAEMHVSAEALRLSNGRLIGAREELEDRVIERTQELTELNHLLTAEIRERGDAEEKAAEYRNDLSHVQRVAMAGEMAAVMAHEINQPLQAISHTANALNRLQDAGLLDPKELAGHLSEISQQARRASEILRQIRGFVRKQPVDLKDLDVDRVIADVVRMMEPMARRSGVRIERVPQLTLPLVKGEEIQLGQLFLNLIRNSVDATAGITGALCTIKSHSPDERTVIVDIEDNGPGISDNLKARVLEPFFSTKSDGLGMGLSICKTIAEAHGATFSIHNRDNGLSGTRVRVSFHRAGA